MIRFLSASIFMLGWLMFFALSSLSAQSLQQNNEILFKEVQRVHGLSNVQMGAIRAIFQRSGYIGQGNPAITRHPFPPHG